MPDVRLLSPTEQAALARDSRLAVVVEVMLVAATTVPAHFPSLVYLGKLAHVSARTLERRFRRVIGTSYRAFRQELRVRGTQMRKLEDPGAPEKALARDSGLSGPASLVRAFVNVEGVTPRGRKSRATRRRPRDRQ